MKPHSELEQTDHRAKAYREPGAGKVDDITDSQAFTAESSAAMEAFSWIQVAVGRFSYYAIVFVAVVVLSGLSYSLVTRRSNEPIGRTDCSSSLVQSSSDNAAAHAEPSSSPLPSCRP